MKTNVNIFTSFLESSEWHNWLNYLNGIVLNDSDKDEYIKNEKNALTSYLRDSYLGRKWHEFTAPDLSSESAKEKGFADFWTHYRKGDLTTDGKGRVSECNEFIFNYFKFKHLSSFEKKPEKEELSEKLADKADIADRIYNDMKLCYNAELRGIGQIGEIDYLKTFLIPLLIERSSGKAKPFAELCCLMYGTEKRTSILRSKFNTFTKFYRKMCAYFPEKKLFNKNYFLKTFSKTDLSAYKYLGNVDF